MTIKLIDVVEQTIYDRDRVACAYLSVDGVIYHFDGQPIGYVYRLAVWTFLGRRVGWFHDGWLRSESGYCVGCTKFARSPPKAGTPPIIRDPPKAPKRTLPTKLARRHAPDVPLVKRGWSRTPLKVFLSWVQHQAGE